MKTFFTCIPKTNQLYASEFPNANFSAIGSFFLLNAVLITGCRF